MSKWSSPVLSGSERKGPSLNVGEVNTSVHQKDVNTRQGAWVLGIVSLLVGLALVSLSLAAKQPDRVSITSTVAAWVMSHTASQSDDSDSDADMDDEESQLEADPFMHDELAELKGQTCFNYMPGGDNPAARQAFERLFWGEIGDDLKKHALSRMEQCTPFQAIESDLIMATGCTKKQCAQNDVRFFIDTEANIAMDFQINGHCQSAAEEGFKYNELLCQRNTTDKTVGVES